MIKNPYKKQFIVTIIIYNLIFPIIYKAMRGVVELNRAASNPFEDSPPFKIASDFEPAGDQPAAIKKLAEGLRDGLSDQVLLGVTGSGKTLHHGACDSRNTASGPHTRSQ
jgi:hypothetical protein